MIAPSGYTAVDLMITSACNSVEALNIDSKRPPVPMSVTERMSLRDESHGPSSGCLRGLGRACTGEVLKPPTQMG